MTTKNPLYHQTSQNSDYDNPPVTKTQSQRAHKILQSTAGKCRSKNCKCSQFQLNKYQPKKCQNCKHSKDSHTNNPSQTKTKTNMKKNIPKKIGPKRLKSPKKQQPAKQAIQRNNRAMTVNTNQNMMNIYQNQQQQQNKNTVLQHINQGHVLQQQYNMHMSTVPVPIHTQVLNRSRSKTAGSPLNKSPHMQQQQPQMHHTPQPMSGKNRFPPPPMLTSNGSMGLQMSLTSNTYPLPPMVLDVDNQPSKALHGRSLNKKFMKIARAACVWKRSLYLQPEYAKNFGCVSCNDIPRYDLYVCKCYCCCFLCCV